MLPPRNCWALPPLEPSLSLVAFFLHRMLSGMLLLSLMPLPWIWAAQVCQCHCTCLPGHTKKALQGPRKQNWPLLHRSPPRRRLRGKRCTNKPLKPNGSFESQEPSTASLLSFQTHPSFSLLGVRMGRIQRPEASHGVGDEEAEAMAITCLKLAVARNSDVGEVRIVQGKGEGHPGCQLAELSSRN